MNMRTVRCACEQFVSCHLATSLMADGFVRWLLVLVHPKEREASQVAYDNE
jgi:hypothetical protein